MKLSIITINYNNAEGLRKTLASVASQTYADIEHIIVDGGSTDGSVEIIREYADNEAIRLEGYEAMRQEKNGKADDTSPNRPIAQSPNRHEIRWISEPDKGIYNAMNKGIEIVLGKRVVNSFNRSELVEDKNKGIEVALGRRVVNDDHTSSPNSLSGVPDKLREFVGCSLASSPYRLTDYIQILNSGDILAADDVTERMMAALASYSEQSERSTGEAELQQSDLPTILYGNMIKEYPDGKRVKDTCLGDSKTHEKEIVLRETEWTMYDFIKGTINHDPTYIRRDIYEKYGLYDDNLKIVSDWKWFVQAVVFGGEKVYYIPMDVTIFDMTGISETNLAAREVERRNELEKMFPKAVLKDYDAYHFPINQIQRLKRHHMWSLVYFVERVLFKLEKWGILK